MKEQIKNLLESKKRSEMMDEWKSSHHFNQGIDTAIESVDEIIKIIVDSILEGTSKMRIGTSEGYIPEDIVRNINKLKE